MNGMPDSLLAPHESTHSLQRKRLVDDAAGNSVHRAFARRRLPQAAYDQGGGLPAPALIRRAKGLSRSGVK
jgi:hypothetical protein